MDLKLLEEIKKLAIIALVSDDELMNKFALKGGNAIDFFYEESARASTDLDFSMRDDFEPDKLEEVKLKLKRLLKETFADSGFVVFDVKFLVKPSEISEDLRGFWGGYKIELKVLRKDSYDSLADMESRKKQAIIVDPSNRRKFGIDISKYEYFEDNEFELDGYTVHVYTRETIIFEKARAICQQMKQYRDIVPTTSRPRSRDFFDIYHLLEGEDIDLYSCENKSLLKKVFEAKKVPLELLKNITNYRELHRGDFASLEDTVKPAIQLECFDFYFDYVVGKFEGIEF